MDADIKPNVCADRAGHAMHAQLVSQLLRQKECWKLTTEEPARPTPALSTSPEFAAAGA